MVLESTMVCVDNSEYMRNGDFLPTRLQAQQDAVNIVCHSKTRSNPENNVGLITLANDCEVLTTLTPDTGRILSKLHTVQPKGKITFCTGIRVAHLALKHRQGKNHKMRIIAFVGSPVEDNEKDALRVSMEEQRQRQEEEARRAAAASAAEAGIATPGTEDSDDALLKMTINQQEFGRPGLPDLSSMTEEEQIAYAMQMSLQGTEFSQESADMDASSAMDTSDPVKEEDDYDVMQDPEFLQSVLENLPGVDPNNAAIRSVMGALASQATKDGKNDKKEEEKK
ncbi:26S proteasome non-ATPase regulatory subunit 4 isoform 8 [Mus musculus]|uniref:26S proteasome non-ATPase regulatory subunit 4 isoform 8 n=1 Tax=Mus musculus TaxID=10090 RepID=UPI00211ECCFE|nr:26S proteasome non-ATPase regulatory subunit 4 isoform 8 [Mus musculus]